MARYVASAESSREREQTFAHLADFSLAFRRNGDRARDGLRRKLAEAPPIANGQERG